MSRGVSIAADARAMQFTQKMIRAMRMLEEISSERDPGSNLSVGISLLSEPSPVGRGPFGRGL